MSKDMTISVKEGVITSEKITLNKPEDINQLGQLVKALGDRPGSVLAQVKKSILAACHHLKVSMTTF